MLAPAPIQLFRETLEAAIIVSVLLALVEQLVSGTSPAHPGYKSTTTLALPREGDDENVETSQSLGDDEELDKNGRTETERRLLRKLRIQIFAGAGIGLFIALAV